MAGHAADRELYEEYQPYAETIDIDLTKPAPSSFLRLWRTARQTKPDIIHANGKAGTVYGLLLSAVLPRRTRFFLTLRGFHDKFSGLKSGFYRYLELLMSRRAEAVICVSPSEREHYLDIIGADPLKTFLVPNGIDVSEAPLPEDIAAETARFAVNVVSLSRISPQKDLVTMIEAFSGATTDRDDVALHIIGGLSHGEEDYQAAVNVAHASSPAAYRIFFWGDRKAAGNLLRHFDAYLSTARFEGLPTAVVEAFLSRIPVMGTSCIGNVDLIRNGETGWLAGIGDIQDIVRALSEVIEAIDEGRAQEITDRAYNEAGAYSVENQAKRLLELYGLN